MASVFELKELAVTETPLLLFECELRNGQVERWSTHRVEADGAWYEPRVLRHNVFEIPTASDQGVDAIPRVSLALANADSYFSQLERSLGWKGSKLAVHFRFFDLRQRTPSSEALTLFHGLANPPEEITESTFRLTAINRMSMHRVLLPAVRIQKRCPWEFPTNYEQRREAVTGELRGKYSRFFRCGYSPDIEDGTGNLNGSEPYTSCGYTRADCEMRGMFRKDNAHRTTRRFGGIEFVPSSILVRSYGEKISHASAVAVNEARYNDFVPLVYGTAWYAPPVVFARNDGNLTHMEVLLGMGEMHNVLKVLVNDIEIPVGRSGTNMTGTGWYNVASWGNRTGNFNLDFTDGSGNPTGDPYGSMAFLSLVVPNRINNGNSLPNVKVLVEGMKLSVYGTEGEYLEERFTNNAAWVLLDILQRCGWSSLEIDMASFSRAAAYCDEQIRATDQYNNPVLIPRFQCNLVVQNRRSGADLIRGIRNASRMLLSYGGGGLLQVRVENTLELEQPEKPAWSNAEESFNAGWPHYEFGDGSSNASGILRRDGGEPSIRLWSRSTADTANRFVVEFQDAFNEYQQDSFSVVNAEDAAITGQEITASATVLGLPNYDQAARILKFHLDKAIQGNTYAEFETSIKALGLSPGDLITLTYLKEGFNRQLFRIIKISPDLNYHAATITAQIHRDEWYSDTNGQAGTDASGRRQPGSGVGLPRPLLGNLVDEDGRIQFEITEGSHEQTDGGLTVEITTAFLAPPAPTPGGPGIPLLSLSSSIGDDGTLEGDQTLYYALSAVGEAGLESTPSFIVRASVPPGGGSNSVTLRHLSFSPGTMAFHVYRGPNPAQLYRIASNQPLTNEFIDTGMDYEAVAPPDSNYDHANFYWRVELQPEYAATLHSPKTVGNNSLEMAEDQYRGMVARITRGKGAGQERTVAGNTDTTLNLTRSWDDEPDATSSFVLAETAWHFGATAHSSPVQFQLPNRIGAVVHISGRAANANNAESALELSTMTRWMIGGAAYDTEAPPRPLFGVGLSGVRGGTLEVSGVAFEDLMNTRTVMAGTLTLHYWDELAGETEFALAAAIDETEGYLELTGAVTAEPGAFLQIEGEIMRVEQVWEDGTRYGVTRAMHGSSATTHAAGAKVYHLLKKVSILPFVRDFFGSPSSGNWSFPLYIPDLRIASAELFVTNGKGNSETASVCMTQTVDRGLRTLSGGQFSMQVAGFLTIDSAAAPDLIVENSHSVRDVFAILKQPPEGGDVDVNIKVDGELYCSLTIPNGQILSDTTSGVTLPPLLAGTRLSLEVTAVGANSPGSDLTVVIRL